MKQNKMLKYTGVDQGYAPDMYVVDVPAGISNSFWNANKTQTGNPVFKFTEMTPSVIEYEKKVFQVSQEISRINEMTYNYYNPDLANTGFNMAAAIGLLPYVKNQAVCNYVGGPNGSIQSYNATCTSPSELVDASGPYAKQNVKTLVKYEDYSKFTITTSDGTKYIFGRPLRGQKYIFGEEPFWSTLRADAGSDYDKSYGELWKTDYIAEWLLTEIQSNDYVDANNNGYADDGDAGDWIKIEYTDPTQYEVTAGMTVPFEVPKHREWINFTQTDRASSLWRERAYVTKVTTPIQTVDFTNSERFDVDYDYFNKIFNRYGQATGSNNYNNYVYTVHDRITGTVPTGTLYDPNGQLVPNANYETRLGPKYPNELRKYDAAIVKENISGYQSPVKNVKFVYAQKGSPQELAVSNYLIIDNNKQFSAYDPSSVGNGLLKSNFYKPDNGGTFNGRGKTTLLSLEYRGSDANSSDKIAFSFDYAFNPKLDDIHLYEIQKMGAFPVIRESPSAVNPRWENDKIIYDPAAPTTPIYLAKSITPWKTFQIGNTFNNPVSFSYTTTENWGYPVRCDELGYYYSAQTSLKGRNAWALSSVTMPYGGTITINYALDSLDIVNDRNEWKKNGLADYAIPSVGHYNNIAHFRSLQQGKVNNDWGSNMTLWKEYYFLMNRNTGGLRISSLTFRDQYTGNIMTKQFEYGLGHYTMPPAAFWQNYVSGFDDFVYYERLNHLLGDGVYSPNWTTSYVQVWDSKFNDYTAFMSALIQNTRVDNSIMQQGKHYYEYIDEVAGDGARTRRYFGRMFDPNQSGQHLAYVNTQASCLKQTTALGGRTNYLELLTSNMDHSLDIGNYKTEYYSANGVVVKEDKQEYEFIELDSNKISLLGQTIPGISLYPWANFQVGNTSPYYPLPSGLKTKNEWLQNPPSLSTYLYDLTPPVTAAIGYAFNPPPYNPTGSIPLNLISEAKEPMLKLCFASGVYSNPPGWFADVISTSFPWTGTSYSTSNIYNALKSFMTTKASVDDGYNEDDYNVKPLTFKSHQSFILRPKTIVSTQNF
jgi:hypothetical protein